jgi:hypothetical protein
LFCEIGDLGIRSLRQFLAMRYYRPKLRVYHPEKKNRQSRSNRLAVFMSPERTRDNAFFEQSCVRDQVMTAGKVSRSVVGGVNTHISHWLTIPGLSRQKERLYDVREIHPFGPASCCRPQHSSLNGMPLDEREAGLPAAYALVQGDREIRPGKD